MDVINVKCRFIRLLIDYAWHVTSIGDWSYPTCNWTILTAVFNEDFLYTDNITLFQTDAREVKHPPARILYPLLLSDITSPHPP